MSKWVPKPKLTKVCPECGETFVAEFRRKATCYKPECHASHIRNQRLRDAAAKRERKLNQAKPGKIREYTDDTVILIIRCEAMGMTVESIADMLDRDVADLARFIKQSKVDGTFDRVKQKLEDAKAEKCRVKQSSNFCTNARVAWSRS